jgi:carboxymethylenebutenolidase
MASSATLSALSVSGDGHGVSISTASFLSGSTPVRVEMFGPEGEGDYPAVLVLHGAGGIDAGNKYVRQFGAAIAAHGVVALLIHYFDRTGTTYAGDATILCEFPVWLETIRDAVTYATKLPNVTPDRLGLVGYSLGGYLAMAHATQDERIRAVVELAGGIDADSAKNARRFPPVLVVHGKDDRRVPFERAKEVQRVWKQAGAEIETRFYPGEGHILSAGAALDALSAGLQFLGAHLGVAVAG